MLIWVAKVLIVKYWKQRRRPFNARYYLSKAFDVVQLLQQSNWNAKIEESIQNTIVLIAKRINFIIFSIRYDKIKNRMQICEMNKNDAATILWSSRTISSYHLAS